MVIVYLLVGLGVFGLLYALANVLDRS